MIFTFKGYNTYIFDLDSKGKALILKDGIIDLGDPSSPDRLGLVRLDNDRISIDIEDETAQSPNGVGKGSYFIGSDETLQFAGNELHLHLNYNEAGMLMGGEFTLKMDAATAKKDSVDPSDNTPISFDPSGVSSITNQPTDTDDSEIASDKTTLTEPPQQQPKRQESSPSRNGANQQQLQDNLERLEEIARETSVIERTVFSENDDDDKQASESDSKHSSRSSNTGSSGRNRARLTQIARETSVIESTFFTEATDNNIPRPQQPSRKERLLKIGEGFKEDMFAGGYEYTVKKFIGRGGFGEVYQIVDRQGNPFALKVLRPDITEDQKYIYALFDNEVSIGRYLSFPGLVRTLEASFDTAHQLRYCIMEYVDGVNFSLVTTFLEEQKTTMHYLYATWIVLKIAKVLDYLSANGVVHRDIKAQNAMLNRQGEIKVLDMGIARQHNDNKPLGAKEPQGTLSYLPQGQLYRRDPVDVRLDIYCLGVMYFRLLTNKPPIPDPPSGCSSRLKYFREMTAKIYANQAPVPDPRKLPSNGKSWEKIPDAVAQIVMKMMAQDVNKRYSNTRELINALSKVVNEDKDPEQAQAELSKLCVAVNDNEPYVKPGYLPLPPNRVRRALWFGFVASILLFCGCYVFYKIKIRDTNFIKAKDRVSELTDERFHEKKKNKDLNLLKLVNEVSSINKKVNRLQSWEESDWEAWKNCLDKRDKISKHMLETKDLMKCEWETIRKKASEIWGNEEFESFDGIVKTTDEISQKINECYKEVSKQLEEDSGNLKAKIEESTLEEAVEKIQTFYDNLQYLVFCDKYNPGQANAGDSPEKFPVCKYYEENPNDISKDKESITNTFNKLKTIVAGLQDDNLDGKKIKDYENKFQDTFSLALELDKSIPSDVADVGDDIRAAIDEVMSKIKNDVYDRFLTYYCKDMMNSAGKIAEMVKTGDENGLSELKSKKSDESYGKITAYRKEIDCNGILAVRLKEADEAREYLQNASNYVRGLEISQNILNLVDGKMIDKAMEKYRGDFWRDFHDARTALEQKAESSVIDSYRKDLLEKWKTLDKNCGDKVYTDIKDRMNDSIAKLDMSLKDMKDEIKRCLSFRGAKSNVSFDSGKYRDDARQILGYTEKEMTTNNEATNELLAKAKQVGKEIEGLADEMDKLKPSLDKAHKLPTPSDDFYKKIKMQEGEKDLEKVRNVFRKRQEVVQEVAKEIKQLGERFTSANIPEEAKQAFSADLASLDMDWRPHAEKVSNMVAKLDKLVQDVATFDAEWKKIFEEEAQAAFDKHKIQSLAERIYNAIKDIKKDLYDGSPEYESINNAKDQIREDQDYCDTLHSNLSKLNGELDALRGRIKDKDSLKTEEAHEKFDREFLTIKSDYFDNNEYNDKSRKILDSLKRKADDAYNAWKQQLKLDWEKKSAEFDEGFKILKEHYDGIKDMKNAVTERQLDDAFGRLTALYHDMEKLKGSGNDVLAVQFKDQYEKLTNKYNTADQEYYRKAKDMLKWNKIDGLKKKYVLLEEKFDRHKAGFNVSIQEMKSTASEIEAEIRQLPKNELAERLRETVNDLENKVSALKKQIDEIH